MSTFGQQMKARRKSKKLSIDELSARTGIHHSTLTIYENKKTFPPKGKHKDKICRALGLINDENVLTDPITGESLGDRLRKQRLAKGLSHRQLAKAIGQFGCGKITRWENNYQSVSVENLKLLCIALDWDANEALGLKEAR